LAVKKKVLFASHTDYLAFKTHNDRIVLKGEQHIPYLAIASEITLI
jgi:hypothetical protein